jgi:nitroreductase
MYYTAPVNDLIRKRFSCRTFLPAPLDAEHRRILDVRAGSLHQGPGGTALRFKLIAAAESHGPELNGLGTYGMIRHPAAFIVGAAEAGPSAGEDYGWAMEQLVLAATDLGLGTCWLGGFFTRTSFSRAIGLTPSERLPAVVAVGLVPDRGRARAGLIRRAIGAARRLPWERLFFDRKFDTPLDPAAPGHYRGALEMVRLAPSASNKQPWRIVREDDNWHFYLSRTQGYAGGPAKRVLGVEDIQRVDIGIAMCHFELTARAAGLQGGWVTQLPGAPVPGQGLEYVATWARG